MKINFLIVLSSIVFSIFLSEILVRTLFSDEAYHQHSAYDTDNYPTLRPSNFSYKAHLIKPDGSDLYNVKHNFDFYGRRKTPVVTEASSGAIFFGGSFVFGKGIEDKDTLPWLFSEKKSKLQSFNYAYKGYGPNNMLATLMEHNLNDQVPPNIQKINSYFFSYGFHTERYLGSFRWIGRNNVNDPYFRLEGTDLVFRDNFAKGRPILTLLYWALYYSKLARLTLRDLGNSGSKSSQKLLCAIVNQSEEKLKSQLKNRFDKFYFVVAPYQNQKRYNSYYDGIKTCLSASIHFLKIATPVEYVQDSEKFHVDDELDRHPNRYANQWLAEKLLNAM